jgi:hypothetical protein
MLFVLHAHSQQGDKKKLAIKRITTPITIDGEINEAAWKNAPVADHFVALRPKPFQPERLENATQVYFYMTMTAYMLAVIYMSRAATVFLMNW